MALVNVIYRVHCVESERGWGRDYFHVDFDTREEAEKYFKETNSIRAPDYYVQANSIEIKEVK